ncbi:MAG TPA: neuraminidase-like domain-containing protein, partial [Blastocatellia bacterium]
VIASRREPEPKREGALTLSASADNSFIVKGQVYGLDRSSLPSVIIQAFDRDLRDEEKLGEIQIDNGHYEIRYAAEQFLQAEKGNADLVVRALAADGSLLVESPTLFNAPPLAEIDLTIPADAWQPPTLFEKIRKSLEPLLVRVKIEELDENEKHRDLSFLAGETGFEKGVLARFILAQRLAQQAIEPEFWFAALGGSFFEYAEDQGLDGQLTAILNSLYALDEAAVRKALAVSFNLKEISEIFQEKIEDWVEAFLEFIAGRMVIESTEPTFVKSALDHAGIEDPAKQKIFARLFNQCRAITPELLEDLQQQGIFDETEIADLRASFQLGDLTRADFSVVRMIKDEFGVKSPEDIRAVAKISQDEWVNLVDTYYKAGSIRIPFEVGEIADKQQLSEAEVFGKTLESRFREAFPTAAFAGGLERALNNGGARGLKHAGALSEFLASHEEFELLNTPVDEFLNGGNEEFRLEVKAAQRVFKLVPTFEATDALLADGLHSAQQIYHMGESEFVRRYGDQPGFTPETARLAWNRAADTHAAVLTIVADLKALEAGGLPLALNSGGNDPSSFPNWGNLFQTGDFCDCEHCRSVLGPAAYFADLLMFLGKRNSAKPGQTVKDILFKRRPDLGYLELNCDNALTTLPYIDVVCETLEDVVAAGRNDLELTGFASMPVDPAAAKAAVAAAFESKEISLGADFSLSQVGTADLWVAHGEAVTYLLKKKAPSINYFAEILRNTKAGAAELRAYPQYVNPKAYEELRQARYPFDLPFDLFAEEARAAFQKIGVKRWELMQTLRGTASPNNPTDVEIAAEYFGISVGDPPSTGEARIILHAAPTDAEQRVFWGEAAIPGNLTNVKVFLRKTGLEFNELLALLDLKFINSAGPAGSIFVDRPDPSCDTGKMLLKNLDAAKLDRIHRFLRLWRKLKGWKMWELDLVIHVIGADQLNEDFLVKLMRFVEVKKRLGAGVTVEQTASLFDNINVETHFTKPHEKREDALYQSLFLNKKLINPLDPAFEIDPATGELKIGETITGHRSVIQSALGLREADLNVFRELKRPGGQPYITNDLTLANLSFLHRHAWLAKTLKFKAEEWAVILKLFNQDLLEFSDPQAAWEFLEKIGWLKETGFKVDELNWLLAADREAKSAVKESDAARFLTELRKELKAIQAEWLAVSAPADVDGLTALLTSLLQRLNRDETAAQFFIATLRDEVSLETKVASLDPGFVDFPQAIKSAIRIRYDQPTATLRFTGLMTAAERTTLLTDPSLPAAVTGNPDYQAAIDELFRRPRMALKFFEPVFSAPLENLPQAVDFKGQLPSALALKISYDAERRLLRFAGIMSKEERTALDALSQDVNYRQAVNSLFNQPANGIHPPEKIWLTDADLKFPLRDLSDPASDHLAMNLTAAVTGAIAYLLKTSSESAVIQRASAQLGLTEALTRNLFTRYALLPDALLAHLTEDFAATTGAIDYATLQSAFDGWFWANRAAAILKKWKITLEEQERLIALPAEAQLFDLLSLPLNQTGAIAPIDNFLRASRLLRLRDNLPETGITLLEVLEKLGGGMYADFAGDVQRLNDAWRADDAGSLVASLDIAATDYLLVESWERLRQAFRFLNDLNAGTATAQKFAAAAMNHDHARTLKELLRSKFGAETWLAVSAEIQDALRERKRDALVAWLLAQPRPADAPSGKWETPNDLYAYYLLDVEMGACQLTSRLAQASGSVQLFVQRCFMGLEPDVVVEDGGDNGDSAWRWWKWMRKYRVWEANRKIFLWPENWIEPELKKDRSPFFKELENELLQNEINQQNVETAFSNYLEKLDAVAQLEIAGFYQEDDGDNAVIHVFGRTRGAEPRLYYYRRYDYRQWTPWEKVPLDIQGDYLIPAVVNNRLFLFWPVFTETPDEAGNSAVKVPTPGQT